MKILVLGCGMIGSVIAKDLAGSIEPSKLVVSDKDLERAKTVASSIKDATWIALDSTDYSNLVKMMERFDLIVGALPGDFGFKALKAAIESRVSMVDVSYTPEDPLELDGEAKEAGVCIIPDCGVAPGLSNMLVGHAASKLDRVQKVHIMVGGIPAYPVEPLGYSVTWSVEGLIDEYMRGARIVDKGRITEVPALSGLEEVDFPGIGRLEAFYTDGLRTLLHTISHVETMWEKTLRYPGHVQKVELLKALGFFGEDPVMVEGLEVSPRKVTAKILEKSLRKPELGDLLAMSVEVIGEKRCEGVCLRYHLLDRHDEAKKVTAMARTTAYTASVTAKKLAQGAIKQKGVIPPEILAMDKTLFQDIQSELKTRGVNVVEAENPIQTKDYQY